MVAQPENSKEREINSEVIVAEHILKVVLGTCTGGKPGKLRANFWSGCGMKPLATSNKGVRRNEVAKVELSFKHRWSKTIRMYSY